MVAKEKTKRISLFMRALLWIAPVVYRAYIGFVLLTSRRVFYNFDRIKKRNDEGRNILAVAWHQDYLLGPFTFRGYNIVTMASRGEWGEIMAAFLKRIGYTAVRGSGSKGGKEALAEIIEYYHSNDKIFCAFAGDGSKGPPQKLQKGMIVIAKECGTPIFPVKTWAKRKILLSTWDRTLVPLPFNECLYFAGDPVSVPPDATPDVMEAKRQELEDNLMKLVKRAEEYYKNTSSSSRHPTESKVVQYGARMPFHY
jgi:lysophospholipid acyltransferase (LPLAT)-like uncharacterized protein